MKPQLVKEAENLGRCLSCNGLYNSDWNDGRPICPKCYEEEVALKSKDKVPEDKHQSRTQ
jgi:Zn finger protein HypA/HybF involved in hydrogenase expression